jgi:hypothetical protein
MTGELRQLFAIHCDVKRTIMTSMIRIIDRLLAWRLLPVGRTRRILIHLVVRLSYPEGPFSPIAQLVHGKTFEVDNATAQLVKELIRVSLVARRG